MECDYKGILLGSMEWLHERTTLVDSDEDTIEETQFANYEQKFTLKRTNVNREDHAGEYSCKLSLPNDDVIIETTTVIVRHAYVLENNMVLEDNMVAGRGDNVGITCVVDSETNPADFTLEKVGGDPVDGRLLQNPNRILATISSFQFEDRGSYRCDFIFSDGNNLGTTLNIVYGTVESEKDCEFVDLNSDSSTRLACTFHGAAEATAVTFTDEEGQVQDGTLEMYTAGTPGTHVGYYVMTPTKVGQFTSKCTFTMAAGESLTAYTEVTTRS